MIRFKLLGKENILKINAKVEAATQTLPACLLVASADAATYAMTACSLVAGVHAATQALTACALVFV